MEMFNNQSKKLGDDLKLNITSYCNLDIVATKFSMYGFDALKQQLKRINGMRFIFSSPIFVTSGMKNKNVREFEIDTVSLEKQISGSNFEIKLKNTLTGTSVAKECASWINNKVEFKSNYTNRIIQPIFNLRSTDHQITYTNVDEFSAAGFGYQKNNTVNNFVIKMEPEDSSNGLMDFNDDFNNMWNDSKLLKDVTSDVLNYVRDLYSENSPEIIYNLTLLNIFQNFLEETNEDNLINERVGLKESVIWNKLFDFQRDAVIGIVNKLETFNGCILADSVGLGKTYTALAVIKYYEERNKNVLVLCPKKLEANWNTFKANYVDNPLYKDRLRYDVLFHTDLTRDGGSSNGIDLQKLNWGNYDLIVIDESHNFRNHNVREDKDTRYFRLLEQVIRTGVKTKVLMLSATPVNNRFNDLKNQIALAYEGDVSTIDEKTGMSKSIEQTLREAQLTFNQWTKFEESERSSKKLVDELSKNLDFFKLLDNVTIARSRRHIENYYDMNAIGTFPKRLKPISIRSEISNLENGITINDIYNLLSGLSLSVFSPLFYLLENKKSFYSEKYDIKVQDGKSYFSQSDRELSLKYLMRTNLLKRLESSVHSFLLTVERLHDNVQATINSIDNFEKNGMNFEIQEVDSAVFNQDEDEWIDEEYSVGKKVKVNLKDLNTLGWKRDLEQDKLNLDLILSYIYEIKPRNDQKLLDLKDKIIDKKMLNQINPGNKKILIFSAFADTVDYLYEHISKYVFDNYGLYTAKVTGTGNNNTTMPIKNKDFNNILMNFSPKSKERDLINKQENNEIDILIATDCISEGQNLQDCDYLVNYDIHWNPVRILQRFGRIDRIGSINKQIQLVNFWPSISLDDYINLKGRVEQRMYIMDMSGTSEDNPLTNKSLDLDYRRKQLEQLQQEVVDIEEMNSGISITDLGLNDFRMDLINFMKEHNDLNKTVNGIHSVVHSDEKKGIRPGVIFVLKNVDDSKNIDKSNQIHPFYMVYISDEGEVLLKHSQPKKILDILRSVSQGQTVPIDDAYRRFNEISNDGENMEIYSGFLNESISSIILENQESTIDSLFTEGGTNALLNDIRGLDNFELITFMVVV